MTFAEDVCEVCGHRPDVRLLARLWALAADEEERADIECSLFDALLDHMEPPMRSPFVALVRQMAETYGPEAAASRTDLPVSVVRKVQSGLAAP